MNIFITWNTFVAGDPHEDDWNKNCGGSSEERVDTGNQRMKRGWLSDG